MKEENETIRETIGETIKNFKLWLNPDDLREFFNENKILVRIAALSVAALLSATGLASAGHHANEDPFVPPTSNVEEEIKEINAREVDYSSIAVALQGNSPEEVDSMNKTVEMLEGLGIPVYAAESSDEMRINLQEAVNKYQDRDVLAIRIGGVSNGTNHVIVCANYYDGIQEHDQDLNSRENRSDVFALALAGPNGKISLGHSDLGEYGQPQVPTTLEKLVRGAGFKGVKTATLAVPDDYIGSLSNQIATAVAICASLSDEERNEIYFRFAGHGNDIAGGTLTFEGLWNGGGIPVSEADADDPVLVNKDYPGIITAEVTGLGPVKAVG